MKKDCWTCIAILTSSIWSVQAGGPAGATWARVPVEECKTCICHLRKQIRKLPKILKFVRIIQYYSKGSSCRAMDSCAIFYWSSLSMYFSYVPSIIFSFFNHPLFLNLLFKQILIQYYSILFNRVLRGGGWGGVAWRRRAFFYIWNGGEAAIIIWDPVSLIAGQPRYLRPMEVPSAIPGKSISYSLIID